METALFIVSSKNLTYHCHRYNVAPNTDNFCKQTETCRVGVNCYLTFTCHYRSKDNRELVYLSVYNFKSESVKDENIPESVYRPCILYFYCVG